MIYLAYHKLWIYVRQIPNTKWCTTRLSFFFLFINNISDSFYKLHKLNKYIEGIKVGNEDIKQSLNADDATLYK